MIEFAFFQRPPLERFLEVARKAGVSARVEEEEEGFTVAIDESLDDDLLEEMEALYDELLEMDQDLFEAGEAEGDNYLMAGVTVQLGDGSTVYANVRPDLLQKVLGAITPDELGELVSAIADAVENPDQRSLCQRVRDGDLIP